MKKWGISKNQHVINFKTENEPKMKFFDFRAFQKIEKMPSHDKILFHMLFGAFHDTSCINSFTRTSKYHESCISFLSYKCILTVKVDKIHQFETNIYRELYQIISSLTETKSLIELKISDLNELGKLRPKSAFLEIKKIPD